MSAQMPPEDIQLAWTGASGEVLLAQSTAFVEAMMAAYRRYSGELRGPVLDYGCGWGRLLRVMSNHCPAGLLYGCDPRDDAIRLCERYGVQAHLALCDYVPMAPPFPGTRFSMIYAFSVFTHLSEHTGKAVMRALRSAIEPTGLLVITVRDLTYWRIHDQRQSVVNIAAMEESHRQRGFAFTPHNYPAIDGDITYGDTSMSLEYIAREWPMWDVLGTEVLQVDAHQRIVYLQPR